MPISVMLLAIVVFIFSAGIGIFVFFFVKKILGGDYQCECGKNMSDRSSFCPSCGCPVKRQ